MSLAFVIFGVGLDDTFIITGEYSRTDAVKDPVKRVEETMEVVGLSIFVTTLTTTMAFGLGSLSAVSFDLLCFAKRENQIPDKAIQLIWSAHLCVRV